MPSARIASSANLIQLWLTQFDRGELNDEEAEASVIAEYEARIAALGRKVGQLTMELDLAKKTPRQPTAQATARDHSIVTGPPACSVRRGCKVIDLPRSTFYYRSTTKRPNPSDHGARHRSSRIFRTNSLLRLSAGNPSSSAAEDIW